MAMAGKANGGLKAYTGGGYTDQGYKVNGFAPPVNYEAEQALLGAILANNAAYFDIADSLKAAHFADPVNGRIYEQCAALIEGGKVANAITLRETLSDADLGDVDGNAYLADLQDNVISLRDAPDYAAHIRAMYVRRQLIAMSDQIAETAGNVDSPLTEDSIVSAIAQRTLAIEEIVTAGAGGLQPMRTVAEEGAKEIERRWKAYSDEIPPGIRTGFKEVDRKLGGLEPGWLVTLAARPAMGKTALALNVARQVAEAGKGVAFFSLEMTRDELYQRLAADRCNIDHGRIRTGSLDGDEMDAIADDRRAVADLPLWVDDTGRRTVLNIESECRKVARRHDLGLVVIDYLQLLASLERYKDENRVGELSEMTRRLKTMAKDLGVPVLMLSQLNRKVEEREDKRPRLSDLRESGSIEQDSDIVAFVFRQQHYVEMEEPKRRAAEDDSDFLVRQQRWDRRLEDCKGKAEVIVDKNRHGPTGIARLACDLSRMRFFDEGTDFFS